MLFQWSASITHVALASVMVVVFVFFIVRWRIPLGITSAKLLLIVSKCSEYLVPWYSTMLCFGFETALTLKILMFSSSR